METYVCIRCWIISKGEWAKPLTDLDNLLFIRFHRGGLAATYNQEDQTTSLSLDEQGRYEVRIPFYEDVGSIVTFLERYGYAVLGHSAAYENDDIVGFARAEFIDIVESLWPNLPDHCDLSIPCGKPWLEVQLVQNFRWEVISLFTKASEAVEWYVIKGKDGEEGGIDAPACIRSMDILPIGVVQAVLVKMANSLKSFFSGKVLEHDQRDRFQELSNLLQSLLT